MARPRVLLLTPFLPAPPHDGGKKRVHTLLRLLSRRCDFILLSFVNGPEEYWHVPSLKKFCRKVVAVPLERDELPPPDDLFAPEVVKSCFSRRYLAALRQILDEDDPDIVHIEFIQMAIYRRWIPGRPVLLTEHDISNMSFFRSYFREMTGWRRWGRLAEWMRLVKFQIDACESFDGIVTLTPEDTAKLRAYVPGRRVKCVPTGVDLSHFVFSPDALRPRRDPEVHMVYVGHYLHYPNEDAMLYFYREIFPRIVDKCPVARLWIVGSGVTKGVEALAADPRVRVTGAVPDVKPYLDRADLYVAPLRLGEGIKGKILEAFAAGVPVVTSSVGSRGLSARSGEHLLVADKPDDFAEAAVRVAFDRDLRRRLVLNARRLAEEKYDWRKLAGGVFEFYREFLSTNGNTKSLKPSSR